MTIGVISRPQRRLDSLTSLRFFAAAMVLVHHGFYLLAPRTPIGSVTSLGFVGVGFFFMLSGFVLTWSHRPDLPVRYFYGRRFARIYPMHLMTAVLALALIVATGGVIDPLRSAMNLLLLQSWVPAEEFGSSLNGVSWSLCCEAFFYLMFPLIIRGMKRWDTRIVSIVAASALVAIAAAAMLFLPTDITQQLLYKGPAYRIGGFILGVALAVRVRNGNGLRISVRVASIFAAASYIVALLVTHAVVMTGLPDLRVYADLITMPASYVLIAAAARSDLGGPSHSLLRRPGLVRLGEASFALYMTHFLLLAGFVTFVGVPQSVLLAFVEVLGLSVIAIFVSLAAYRWVEHPAEKFIRSRIGSPAVSVLG